MSQSLIDRNLLREKLKEYFGFTSFKGNQEEVIMNLLSGRDTFVLMPTGGGTHDGWRSHYHLPSHCADEEPG